MSETAFGEYKAKLQHAKKAFGAGFKIRHSADWIELDNFPRPPALERAAVTPIDAES